MLCHQLPCTASATGYLSGVRYTSRGRRHSMQAFSMHASNVLPFSTSECHAGCKGSFHIHTSVVPQLNAVAKTTAQSTTELCVML
jgi:hypothetical protein